MKGLILKDLYMAKAYLRTFLILILLFVVMSSLSSENTFFLFYPIILAGSVPFSLIAYDERSKWNQYCCTLPVSRKTVVSARYAVSVLCFASVFLLITLFQLFSPSFSLDQYALTLSLLVALGLLTPSILLPLTFYFGVEKGRLFYYVLIGVFCALSVTASNIFDFANRHFSVPLLLLPLASIGLFLLSWVISVKLYEKKEL